MITTVPTGAQRGFYGVSGVSAANDPVNPPTKLTIGPELISVDRSFLSTSFSLLKSQIRTITEYECAGD
jgi:hypothetical protein